MSTLKREQTIQADIEREQNLKGYIGELEAEMLKKKDEAKSIRQELIDLEDNRSVQLAKNKLLEEAMTDALSGMAELEAKEKMVWREIEEKKKDIEQLKAEITDLLGKKACYVGDADTWNNKIIALKEEKDSLTAKRIELLEDIEQLEATKKRLSANNDAIMVDFGATSMKFKADIRELTESYNALERDKNKILAEIEEQRLEVQQDRDFALRMNKTSEERVKEVNYQIEKVKNVLAKINNLETVPSEIKSDLRVLNYSINKI